jgi:hypothetical protein
MTAPEENPSRKWSRSRNRTAAIPPSPVETSVIDARIIGMNRMVAVAGSIGSLDVTEKLPRL